jgi:DNA repair photolyase
MAETGFPEEDETMIDGKHFSDQPIVPGADVIYRPAGNAGEYAPLATNPWRGCGHMCAYCYVPNATHIDRKIFDAGAIFRSDYTSRLIRDMKRHRHLSGTPAEQIFISFSSDPFHLGSLEPTRGVIEILQEGGLAFCTLSKGGSRALDFIDLYRPDRDAYACTLTTMDAAFSRKWERKAALPWDRIDTLRRFHDRGIFTWVSLEPTLDADASLEIVKATHEFVDLYKIGRANYLKEITRTTDWRDYTLRMIDLCHALDIRHYIKRDLQQFLPPGYVNPLRVKQHHGTCQ